MTGTVLPQPTKQLQTPILQPSPVQSGLWFLRPAASDCMLGTPSIVWHAAPFAWERDCLMEGRCWGPPLIPPFLTASAREVSAYGPHHNLLSKVFYLKGLRLCFELEGEQRFKNTGFPHLFPASSSPKPRATELASSSQPNPSPHRSRIRPNPLRWPLTASLRLTRSTSHSFY